MNILVHLGVKKDDAEAHKSKWLAIAQGDS